MPRCTVTPTDVQMCHGLGCLHAFGPESPLPKFSSSLLHPHPHPSLWFCTWVRSFFFQEALWFLRLFWGLLVCIPNALHVCFSLCIYLSISFLHSLAFSPLWMLQTFWYILLHKRWIKNDTQTNHSVSLRWKKTASYYVLWISQALCFVLQVTYLVILSQICPETDIITNIIIL